MVLLSDQQIIEVINNKYSKFEYAGGYKSIDGYIYLRCKDCGQTFKHNAQILRPTRKEKIKCDNCFKIKQNIKKEQKEIRNNRIKFINIIKKRIKEINKIKKQSIIYNNKCQYCGKEFISNKAKKYCSNKCCNKSHDKKKEIKRRLRIKNNKDADYSISIERLIKRDNNICYLCNKECNSDDYYINYKGAFIAGNNYPSIDHIIPIAKGGSHTWSNVRLAHRICNTKKNDKRFKTLENGQLKMYI